MSIDWATAQIIGDRDNQEDTLATHALEANNRERAGELLLVLADGMGGHTGGEVASKLVVEHFLQTYINSHTNIVESLRNSLDSANEQLANTVAYTPALGGMATTLTGCVISENRMYWISVGDSPLWVFRKGTLLRMNADHSMVPLLNDMVRAGIMDAGQARVDTRRNLLRSGVSGKIIELVDVCEKPWQLETGDIIVLASDGVETLSESELTAVLGNPDNESVQSLAAHLMNRIGAARHTGQDNASVILYRHQMDTTRKN